MPLKDLAEFLEPLTPIYKGKGYPLPPVGVRDAIPLMQTLDADDEFFLSEEEFERILLGPALEQLREDNVPPVIIRHLFRCAIVDFSQGRKAAEAVYLEGPSDLPKAETPPSSPEESEPSTGTGEANGTPSRASTTGTTTSRKTSPRKTTGTRSGGTRSSTSGRSSKQGTEPSSAKTS